MTRIGVVGEGSDEVVALAEDRGVTAVADDASTVAHADAEVVVALGESALFSLVREGATAPVLPVDAGPGVGSVPGKSLAAAVSRLANGDFERGSLPSLTVAVGDDAHRALADAMLVTAEAADISEYGVHAPGRRGEERTVDTVRADGVLVSTAAGSVGYGRAADGPTVGPGVAGVSVVPIAPFRVRQTNRVLSLPVRLTVERDESDVTLLVDDRDAGGVPPDEPVRVSAGSDVPVAVVPQSRGFFD